MVKKENVNIYPNVQYLEIICIKFCNVLIPRSGL